jgi:hypothetical protein
MIAGVYLRKNPEACETIRIGLHVTPISVRIDAVESKERLYFLPRNVSFLKITRVERSGWTAVEKDFFHVEASKNRVRKGERLN